MRLIYTVCSAPKRLAGEYNFDYYGDFLWFLRQFSISAALRDRYTKTLEKYGNLTVTTGKCNLTATMDLIQYHERYQLARLRAEK